MTGFQKTVKYMAMGFGIALAVFIITIIGYTTLTLFGIFSGIGNFNLKFGESINHTADFADEEIHSIQIENSVSELKIIAGDSISLDCRNIDEDFVSEVTPEGVLLIKNKNLTIKGINKNNSKIILTVPYEYVFRQVKLSNGAGTIQIDSLFTDHFILNGGVGEIKGEHIYAKRSQIESGVGELKFTNCKFSDMDLNGAAGSIYIQGRIIGDSSIDCGIGEVELDIDGNIKDYNLNIKKGLGSIKVNDNSYSEYNQNNPAAEHNLKISGGIGDIKLYFN